MERHGMPQNIQTFWCDFFVLVQWRSNISYELSIFPQLDIQSQGGPCNSCIVSGGGDSLQMKVLHCGKIDVAHIQMRSRPFQGPLASRPNHNCLSPPNAGVLVWVLPTGVTKSEAWPLLSALDQQTIRPWRKRGLTDQSTV